MKFRDWAEFVQPEVPGCPLFQIDKAVREAAITLCSMADIYRAEPEVIVFGRGVSEYQLPAPTGAEATRVLDLQHNGRPLKKVTSEQEIYSMLDRSPPSVPTHYYQRDNEAIIVAPAPAETFSARLFLALKPSATSTSIPDGIGRENRDLIAKGAKANLMLMGAQPWTNPPLGAANKQMFDRGVSATIRRVTFGFNGAPLTVKRRPFI